MEWKAVRCTLGSMCKGPDGYKCWDSPLGGGHNRRASLRLASRPNTTPHSPHGRRSWVQLRTS